MGMGTHRRCWQGFLVAPGTYVVMHHMVMQTLFFSSLQLSGGDAECSCDEGDETSRKKRSRSL